MRRTITTLLIFGLVFGAFVAAPAEAKKKKRVRVAESKYEAPALGISPPGVGICLRPTNSCGDIPTGSTERYAKIEITDATGLPVAFHVGQDTDPETFGTETAIGDFCGTTGKKAVPIEPGYALVIFPWAAGADCGAVATQGTVKATLSNLP